jgi:hypothetical protein
MDYGCGMIRRETAIPLGDCLSELMEGRVGPQQKRFALVAEVWGEILPGELFRHCRIVDISGGRLKVIADSSAYVYEMQLLSAELVKEFAERCPGARIKEIRVAVG